MSLRIRILNQVLLNKFSGHKTFIHKTERTIIMILIGIDVGKNSHYFTIVNKEDGEILLEPSKFNNNLDGFNLLLRSIKSYKKDDVLIGMLLDKHYTVALINPVTTDLTRRASGSVSKTDKLDTLTICDVLASNNRKKPYRISKINRFDLYEQRCLTRHHHNLKEELNVYSNRLQKCIDIVFPEYNSLFTSKYGIVYNNILKTFTSAANIAKADIRSLRKCFNFKRQGKRISLTADKLKQAAKDSIGIDSISEVIQIRHLIEQIELINKQLEEIDKKIEEFSKQANSPITSIPGISHFSGTSILAELGDINNFSNHKQIIKYAGVAPSTYESSQFKAQHTSITKKGSKYLRKTLYQIILPVINNNKVFKEYYSLKISQGKSHRCACGHCIRKLLRIIYHLLTNNITYDPSVVR